MGTDEKVKPPRPLKWYPNNYAWHMDFSRGQLRKLPLLGQIHEFLKRANDAGSISRQEAVSMVPPLFMDVQSHHRVRGPYEEDTHHQSGAFGGHFVPFVFPGCSPIWLCSRFEIDEKGL